MDSTHSVHSTTGSGGAVRAALKPTAEIRYEIASRRTDHRVATEPDAKSTGYGLPCAQCKTYYSSSLSACPICKSSERVSPTRLAPTPEPAAGSPPDGAGLVAERDRFLREFKAKLFEAHRQVHPSSHLACVLARPEESGHEPASVCESCYAQLQSRLDRFEAALHMDLKEASQVVYDAVWADPSDSAQTYRNAAQALLTELRKRAGMKMVLSSQQFLPH